MRSYFPINIEDGAVRLTDAQKFAFVSGMLAGLRCSNKTGKPQTFRIGTLYPIRGGGSGGIGLMGADTQYVEGTSTYRIPISVHDVDTTYAGFGIKLSFDASRISVLSVTEGNIGSLSDVFIGQSSCFARCICGDYEVVEGETEAYIKAIEPRTEFSFEQVVCWLTVQVLQAPTVDNPIIFHFEGTNGNDYNASALYHWSYYPEADGHILSLITPIVNKDFKISGTVSQYGTTIDVDVPFESMPYVGEYVDIGNCLAQYSLGYAAINLETTKYEDFEFNRLTFDVSISSDTQANWFDFVVNESEDFIKIFYNNTGTDLTPNVPWTIDYSLEYRNGHGEVVVDPTTEPWDWKIVHVTVSFDEYIKKVRMCLGALRVFIRHPMVDQNNPILCDNARIWNGEDYIDLDGRDGSVYWPPPSPGGGGGAGGGGGFEGYGGGGVAYSGVVYSSYEGLLWIVSGDGLATVEYVEPGYNYISGFIPNASSPELSFISQGYIYIPIGFQITVYPNESNAYNLAPNFKIYEQVSFIDDYAIELYIPPVPPAPIDLDNLTDTVELEDDYVFVLRPIHTDSLPSIEGTDFEDAYSIDTINLNIKYKDITDTIQFEDILDVEGPEVFDTDKIFEDIDYADAYSLNIKHISVKNTDKFEEVVLEDCYSVLITGVIPPISADNIQESIEYIDRLDVLSKIIGKKTELNSDDASFNDVFAYNTKRLSMIYKTFGDEVNITDVYSIERSAV